MSKRKPGRRELGGLADDSDFLFLAVGLDEQGCRNFAAAVLYAACLDARGGSMEALDWLEGPDARCWAEALNLDLYEWPPPLQVLISMTTPGGSTMRKPPARSLVDATATGRAGDRQPARRGLSLDL